MRINKFIAHNTGISRRAADALVTEGKVQVNGLPAFSGQNVTEADTITLDNKPLVRTTSLLPITLILNKPVGYVVSRNGQGSRTVYDLLPPEYHHLKPVGRLDKDSSGLLVLTSNGTLAHQLTHPSFEKEKIYEIALDKPLAEKDYNAITKTGVNIGDERLSKFQILDFKFQNNDTSVSNIKKLSTSIEILNLKFEITITEGRNRQIRRTFAALGYQVTKLHRTHFGPYTLKGIDKPSTFFEV